jgi:hypothetical protein
MWTERQWRDRRIGNSDVLWSWAIVGLIVVSLAAWAGVEALLTTSPTPVVARTGN